jgi:nucleobase:cation symporter-1, NCS1 family
MMADYYFVTKGNTVVPDLYTSRPDGRYWYTAGFNWRAYAAYICGLGLTFPGFLGSLGVKGVSDPTGAAMKMFDSKLYT